MLQVVMPFDGKSVEVIRNESGEPFVSVRSVCQAIGIESYRQAEKIKSNPTYKGSTYVVPSAGGPQETFCLPLNQLNLWLGSINPMRTQEPVRSNLIAYQRECADVLYRHFMPRGEVDLQPFMDRFDRLEKKLDSLGGIADTVFGDEKDEIQALVEQVARAKGVDGRTVWGWVQTNCDVGSYKKQNMKIKNYLRTLLGVGLQIVKD